MSTRINLWRALFGEKPRILLENSDFTVTSFRYDSGVEGLKIANSRGHLIILPWMGQMIWDAQFDGHGLTMCNMFRQPKPATEVIETYGCFAFHSGLLANGCPSAEDTHLLHGEMACAAMDEAWMELEGDMLRLTGRYEYVMGFGHHYLAQPTVVLHKSSTLFDIKMAVTNLASVDMPLQYMCHMNYAYIPNATFSQNIPDEILRLRESVPSHVNPTAQWLAFNQRIMQGEVSLSDSIETDKEGNALQLMDVVGVDDTMLDDIHDRDSALRLHQIIRERLTTREAEIIRLRYGLGGTIPLTQREIAASFGISRSYVSRRGYCKRRPESLVGQGFRASSVTRIVPRLLYAVRKSRISGHSLVRTINRVVFGILPSRKYQSFQK